MDIDTELEAAYSEYEALEKARKFLKLDPDFEANTAAMNAVKAKIDLLKRKRKMNTNFIDKEISIDDAIMPSKTKLAYVDYPFYKMLVGQSFAVPSGGREQHNARMAICRYKKQNPGWNYMSQQQPENGTCRFWRIA